MIEDAFFESLEPDEVESAVPIDSFSGTRKSLDLIEIDGERLLRIGKSGLEQSVSMHTPDLTVLEANLSAPERLRELGIAAPSTAVVGNYLLIEFVEGEPAHEVDDVDSEKLGRVLGGMLALGNADADPLNVLVTDTGKYVAIDFDYYFQPVSWAVERFELSTVEHLSDVTVRESKAYLERFRGERERI